MQKLRRIIATLSATAVMLSLYAVLPLTASAVELDSDESKPAVWSYGTLSTPPVGSIIQDPVFYAEVLRIIKQPDGYEIKSTDVDTIQTLLINSLGIKDVTGIEHFTSLRHLYLYENQLTTLDVSKNNKLQWLSVARNQLTTLDVSKNIALTQLDCAYNQLISLDLSKNTALTHLTCGGDQLTSLVFSKNTALTELYVFGEQLTSLDVSNNTALTRITVMGTNITSLDASKNTELMYLYLSDGQLTSLDVSNNPALLELNVAGNKLTSLDVSKSSSLERLLCNQNQLTTLDVSNNPALLELDVSNLHTVEFEVILTSEDNTKNQLTTLDLSNNIALQWLNVIGNKLTSLDVSRNTALTQLLCDGNQLTSLDVSRNTALTQLWCIDNRLTSLDASNNTALISLEVNFNYIPDVSAVKLPPGKTFDDERFIFYPQRFVDHLIEDEITDPTPPPADWTEVESFVDRLYNNVLGRTPDEEGFDAWVDRLMKGEFTGAEMAFGFYFSLEFLAKGLSDEDFVDNLYQTIMGRPGEDEGVTHWLTMLAGGMARDKVVAEFVGGIEFEGLCAAAGMQVGEPKPQQEEALNAFVWRLYRLCLERTPEVEEMRTWTGRLMTGTWTGTQVANNFVLGKELTEKNLSNQAFLEVMYNAFMGRMYDDEGLAAWLDRMSRGMSRQNVFNGFASSDEFAGICAGYGIRR